MARSCTAFRCRRSELRIDERDQKSSDSSLPCCLVADLSLPYLLSRMHSILRQDSLPVNAFSALLFFIS